MNTITRSEKIQHAEENLQRDGGYALSSGLLDKSFPVPGNDIPLQYLETASIDSRLDDFKTWLHEAPIARDLREGGATLKQALPSYRAALSHKLAQMKEWQPVAEAYIDRRLQQLAEAGHIPSVLAERYRAQPNSAMVDLKLADSSKSSKRAAAYEADTHIAYMRPWKTSEQFVSSFTHETFHGLSGTTVKKRQDKVETSRLGLGTNIVGERGYKGSEVGRHRAINEGITEYLRNLVLHDQPGAVSPERRGDGDTRIYKTERKIVQILADRVGLDTLLDAYAEDYEPGKPESMQHTRELMYRIRKAYGPGFLHKLDKLDREEGPEGALAFVKKIEAEVEERKRAKSVGQKIGAFLGMNSLRL